MSGGLQVRPLDTVLVTRAIDFLSGGPSDPASLVSAVCQQPGTPAFVAEHLAVALLAGDDRFTRLMDGRWSLVPAGVRAVTESTRTYHAASSDALASLSFVVVDVETTGGRPWMGDRITEIGAVVVENGRVLEEERFEQLVNPQRPIPPVVSRLTNISWEMVRDKPTFPNVCQQFLSLVRGRVFAAHNAAFDWRFVSAEVQRATGMRMEGRRLCTVKLARKLLPQLPRRTLANVARHYGIEMTSHAGPPGRGRHRGQDDALVAHTAAGDAVATAHVLLGLLRDARDRGCSDWWELAELCSQRAQRRRRPRGRRSGRPTSIDKDTTA